MDGFSDEQPLLSLCMIARDNERTIRNALASVKPWVDEMIVVDTGSIDRTPEIARQVGARVEHFPWCDDFAAARNCSLEYATGKWLFWMDTDDTLPQKCGAQIRNAIRDDIPEDVLGFIMQVHCPSNSQNGETSAIEDQSPLPSATIVDHVKLLRNRADLRFEGRIHEQILPAIRRAGGRVVWTDNYVVHSGADYSLAGARRKIDRDLRLLHLDIQERPGHPFVLFNLGMTLLHHGECDEARTTLEKCIESSSTDESHLRKAYVLLAESLEGLQLHTEALRRCWEGLGRYPNDPELAFKLGRLLMLRRDWDEAITAFGRVLKPHRERYFASIDPSIKGHKAFANLAMCYTELGQTHEALGAWQACLNCAPHFVDAWDGILEISKELNDLRPLVQVVHELQDKSVAQNYVWVFKALIQDSKGSFQDAVRCFESALQAGGENAFVLNEYARFLNERQQWQASLPILRRLRDLDPANPSPHFNLGICLQQLGRCVEAAESLQTSLRLRPGHRRTRSLLRQCHINAKSAKREQNTSPPHLRGTVIPSTGDG